MQCSIFAYADIGLQTGRPLTYMSEFFHNKGLLYRVYSRGSSVNNQLPINKPIPGGRILPQFLTAIDRYVINVPNRATAEQIFDYFAASRAETDKSDIHFHYAPGYMKTFDAGQKQDTPIIVRGQTELVEQSDRRLQTEADRWGVTLNRSRKSQTHKRRVKWRKQTLKQADHIIALSEFVKESYTEINVSPDNISVIPLGVDVDDYPTSNKLSDSTFSAVYVGSINLLKGIPYLLQAWEQLEWEDASLILCGDVSDNISHLVNSSPKTVKTPGFVDPRNYLLNADVFVFPSLSEGFAKAPLEAMATGTPVIVTSNSGVTDIMTDGEDGLIIPPGDPNVIAEKVAYLRNNPKERIRMGEAAYKTASDYPWERHCQRLEDILTTFSFNGS